MPEDRPSPPASGSIADPEATYTIDDLTAQAGVTVRTVRYYIGEGLLPPPLGAGPGTRYTREHLDTLLLIGALKDRYLPLREIRRRLQGMDPAAIHEAIEGMHARTGSEDAEQPERGAAVAMMSPPDPPDALLGADAGDASAPGSASSYIEALLQEDPGVPHHRRAARRAQRSRRQGDGMRFPAPPNLPDVTDISTPDMFPISADPDERRWRKLAITPEAELTIEEDLYHRRREQIESLVAHIRRVLTSS